MPPPSQSTLGHQSNSVPRTEHALYVELANKVRPSSRRPGQTAEQEADAVAAEAGATGPQ